MDVATQLVLALSIAVLVRARPWGAVVTRLPVPDMVKELALCGYCLGFWVGAVASVLTWSNIFVNAFSISAAAGFLVQLMALLDAATDYLNAKTSELRK